MPSDITISIEGLTYRPSALRQWLNIETSSDFVVGVDSSSTADLNYVESSTNSNVFPMEILNNAAIISEDNSKPNIESTNELKPDINALSGELMRALDLPPFLYTSNYEMINGVSKNNNDLLEYVKSMMRPTYTLNIENMLEYSDPDLIVRLNNITERIDLM